MPSYQQAHCYTRFHSILVPWSWPLLAWQKRPKIESSSLHDPSEKTSELTRSPKKREREVYTMDLGDIIETHVGGQYNTLLVLRIGHHITMIMYHVELHLIYQSGSMSLRWWWKSICFSSLQKPSLRKKRYNYRKSILGIEVIANL